MHGTARYNAFVSRWKLLSWLYLRGRRYCRILFFFPTYLRSWLRRPELSTIVSFRPVSMCVSWRLTRRGQDSVLALGGLPWAAAFRVYSEPERGWATLEHFMVRLSCGWLSALLFIMSTSFALPSMFERGAARASAPAMVKMMTDLKSIAVAGGRIAQCTVYFKAFIGSCGPPVHPGCSSPHVYS